MRPQALTAAVEHVLDTSVVGLTTVSGGDVAEAYRADLVDGRSVFVKTHRDPPPGFFTTEAAGLAWIAESDTVRVPDVLAVSDGEADWLPFLMLEWIDVGGLDANTEQQFGRALADLHRAGAPCFGRSDRRTTGSRRLPNEPCDSWIEFFREQRLVPLRRLATDSRALAASTLKLLDEVIGSVSDLGVPVEPPARLHGDLWAGNRIVDATGRSVLIDPAAHGGHREFDLAMMRLFGGYGAACFAAYQDQHPLADGWEQRIPLHQLAPLIVHAIKFGGSYAGATESALRATLAL